MKTKLFNFRGITLFQGICSVTAMVLCLYACSALQPSGENQPQPAQQKSAQPQKQSTGEATVAAPAPSKAASGQDIKTEPPSRLEVIYRASLRAAPLPKGKVITRLKRGEKVIKLDESGIWVHVELSDKTTGWILKKQTREAK